MASVTFRPLREDELEARSEQHARGYAEGMIAFADLSRKDVEAKGDS